MESKIFSALVKKRLDHIMQTLVVKGEEYARGEDRLSNFKRAADLKQTTPERALEGMVTKQIVSMYDFLDDLDSNIHHTEKEWLEKLGDIRIYSLLLEGLLAERYGWSSDASAGASLSGTATTGLMDKVLGGLFRNKIPTI